MNRKDENKKIYAQNKSDGTTLCAKQRQSSVGQLLNNTNNTLQHHLFSLKRK